MTAREMADRILRVGGVQTFDGKWVEVERRGMDARSRSEGMCSTSVEEGIN